MVSDAKTSRCGLNLLKRGVREARPMILAVRSRNTTCWAVQCHCHVLYCYRGAEQLTHASHSASFTALAGARDAFPARERVSCTANPRWSASARTGAHPDGRAGRTVARDARLRGQGCPGAADLRHRRHRVWVPGLSCGEGFSYPVFVRGFCGALFCFFPALNSHDAGRSCS